MPKRHRTYWLPTDARTRRRRSIWIVGLSVATLLTPLVVGLLQPDRRERLDGLHASGASGALPLAATTIPPLPPTVPVASLGSDAESVHFGGGIHAGASPLFASARSAPESAPHRSWNLESVPSSTFRPRPPSNLVEVQIALASSGIDVGPIDGVMGSQTEDGLRLFQSRHHLAVSGRLDGPTLRTLSLTAPPFIRTRISAVITQSLVRIPDSWLAKSQLRHLGFESIIECLSEQSHTHPHLVRRLNPSLNGTGTGIATDVVLPNPRMPTPRRGARIRINLRSRHLRVSDDSGNLLCHFPCSIGRLGSSGPVGDMHVTSVVKDPNYTFDPRVFPESAEARSLGRRLVLPPGPNNPVGTTWIGLDRPGYGIHGTPIPERIGRTESHGCFRLANWNADYLRQLVWIGMPVSVGDKD